MSEFEIVEIDAVVGREDSTEAALGAGAHAARPMGPDTPLKERELIERARRGEERAFRDLYDRNVERVFRVVFRMVGNEATAADLTQEAFIKAFAGLDDFRGDAAFSTWLYSIAVSVTLSHAEKQKRRRELAAARPRPVGNGATAPETIRSDVKERLTDAIDGLDEIYRTVLVMHDLEGFTHQEIAGALDVAVGTSKARLSRARAQLRDVLGEAMREYVR